MKNWKHVGKTIWKKAWKFKLAQDYRYRHSAFTGIEFANDWTRITDGQITVFKGYAWDGCSPKFTLTGLFTFGTPDGVLRHGLPWTYHASLVHDVLCQFRPDHGLTQRQVTDLFADMLTQTRWPLTWLYVRAVWHLGPKDF